MLFVSTFRFKDFEWKCVLPNAGRQRRRVVCSVKTNILTFSFGPKKGFSFTWAGPVAVEIDG